MDDVGFLPARHRMSVERFEEMIRAGILGKEDRIELVGGELIDMAPIGDGHAAAVNWLTRTLVLAFGERAVIAPQNPVFIDAVSLPQPDIAVLRDRPGFYADRRPQPADVLLLVEVADSSLRFDQTVKLPRYARAGIAEFWIVNLGGRVVEVYREPEGDAYREMTAYRIGERIVLALAPDTIITLSSLFG